MNTKYLFVLAVLQVFLLATPSQATISGLPDLDRDFKPTGLNKKLIASGAITYAPMDFQKQNLSLNFDALEKVSTGRSSIVFIQHYSGRPYFDISMPVRNVKLNGQAVSTSEIQDPDGLGQKYIALEKDLAAGSLNHLELEYDFTAGKITYENGGIGFFTSMTDLWSRFFEYSGPSNFEDDAFPMTVHLKIKNSEQAHRIFANGRVTRLNSFEWTVDFPSHFTSSSFYLHLTNKPLFVKRFALSGEENSIPVVVYADNAALVDEAINLLPGYFTEMEADFGAYPHESFVAYIQSGGGGMEYVGATITSIRALGHELFHSWFARGVMPAEGRSGWIDEAFASWRDNAYFKADTLLKRTPTNLSNFSSFRKSTPDNCYLDGRRMIAELDVFLADVGGMKPLMRDFFQRYRYRVITTEEFMGFLKAKSGREIEPFFQRYAFNVNTGMNLDGSPQTSGDEGTWTDNVNLHPRPLTESEIRDLR